MFEVVSISDLLWVFSSTMISSNVETYPKGTQERHVVLSCIALPSLLILFPCQPPPSFHPAHRPWSVISPSPSFPLFLLPFPFLFPYLILMFLPSRILSSSHPQSVSNLCCYPSPLHVAPTPNDFLPCVPSFQGVSRISSYKKSAEERERMQWRA